MSGVDAARIETAFSLSFHILFAVFGVGMPWVLLYTEGRWLKTGDATWYALTRKWARVTAVLFAIGAVSGTVLSFEFGLLWPTFMATYGGAIGLLFTLEAFAFFLEAIFMGLYLYGWKRLTPKAHWLTLWPIAISGTLSTLFIVFANSWMNDPVGIGVSHGRITADPAAIFRSASGWSEVTHMFVAALMCTGGAVAGVYAWGMLRGRRDRYHRLGLNVGLWTVLGLTPVQMFLGDWSARVVSTTQPLKLAAMEAVSQTGTHVPLTIGGYYDQNTHKMIGGIPIPDGLSLLLGYSANTKVTGLDSATAADTPQVAVVHLAFDSMVGCGSLVFLIAGLAVLTWWRRRRSGLTPRIPHTRFWLWAAIATGPASVIAMLGGWEVTEGGRQPWIVYGRMLVTDAASKSGGLGWSVLATILIYLGLAAALLLILRKLATGAPPELAGSDPEGAPAPVVPQAEEVTA
ncbi:cytochrome ubiquinol oxidase subunit I [Actinospica durhamensis]|uniref:Cytochrome ubiquinol oxidase subunit I n=1 Tax=Actinospica durhamensis TaxID=1508375 RepID=A0A941ER49_9ACTN|nr:cytochrome ubiquinol oxidase subunit I [Actinospica durhamensis]MBR7835915.1 cytochrome ubiquinol oxidase subunit I [Actinospica durhamensis]